MNAKGQKMRRAHDYSWEQMFGNLREFRSMVKNQRYKISHSKRMLCLRVCWSNVMRVRLLHQCLYGKDGIDFVSMDQKPLYFNSSLASKNARAARREESRREGVRGSLAGALHIDDQLRVLVCDQAAWVGRSLPLRRR